MSLILHKCNLCADSRAYNLRQLAGHVIVFHLSVISRLVAVDPKVMHDAGDHYADGRPGSGVVSLTGPEEDDQEARDQDDRLKQEADVSSEQAQ